MKEKILHSALLRRILKFGPVSKVISHPFFSKFCNYEVISYLICGVLTTAVDFVIYFLFRFLGFGTILSTSAAWLGAVAFAYLVNKVFVFLSTDFSASGILKELIPFVTCRILSYFVNVIGLFLTVDCLHLQEFLMKVLCSILVLIMNYVASKFLIFRKQS